MVVDGPDARWLHREVEATDTHDASLQAQALARAEGGTVDSVRPLPNTVTPSAGQQLQHSRWAVRILLPPKDDPDA